MGAVGINSRDILKLNVFIHFGRFLYLFVYVLPACISVPKETVKFLGTGVIPAVGHLRWVQGIEPRSSVEPQILLTSEIALQPPN